MVDIHSLWHNQNGQTLKELSPFPPSPTPVPTYCGVLQQMSVLVSLIHFFIYISNIIFLPPASVKVLTHLLASMSCP